ncbi:MAG: FtsB family cell division protein [Blautia sp.]
MKTSKSRQKKNRIRNRLGMFSIMLVTLVLLGVFLLQTNDLREKIAAYDKQTASLQEQLEEEQKRTEEIEDTKAYMQTDEYAEEVARNRLGLVKENEVVFQEEE